MPIPEERLGESYTSREFLRVVCHTFNITNKKYFSQLAEALEDDEIRGEDDQDVSDDEPEQNDAIAPEDLFHQDDDDVEITLTRPQPQGELLLYLTRPKSTWTSPITFEYHAFGKAQCII